MTAQAKKLLEQIRALPANEQLKLVELIAHDLAGPTAARGDEDATLFGLFAHEPELIDDIERGAMEARERDPLRRGGA